MMDLKKKANGQKQSKKEKGRELKKVWRAWTTEVKRIAKAKKPMERGGRLIRTGVAAKSGENLIGGGWWDMFT